MYKIQIVDVVNEEILIEEDHNDLNFISELFNTSPNPNVIDCLITDSMNKTRKCKFVSCSLIYYFPTEDSLFNFVQGIAQK